MYKTKKKAAYGNIFSKAVANPTTILDKRLENTTGGHNKFWEIRVLDNGAYYSTGYRFNVEISYGKIDTRGMHSVKDFTSQKAMDAFVNTKIQEKIAKGYVEVGASGAAPTAVPQPPSKATLRTLKEEVTLCAKDLSNVCDSLATGISREIIVTLIIGGEVFQETIK